MEPLIAPYVRSGDFQLIHHPIDFVGVNFYFPERVVRNPNATFGFQEIPATPRRSQRRRWVGKLGRPVWPLPLEAIKNRYPKVPPIYITENGAAFVDTVKSDGSINDRERTEYIQEHLGAIADARQAGVVSACYFVWSLLDNFEWAYGYDRRFGLTYVDYTTQKRTPKASSPGTSSLSSRRKRVDIGALGSTLVGEAPERSSAVTRVDRDSTPQVNTRPKIAPTCPT